MTEPGDRAPRATRKPKYFGMSMTFLCAGSLSFSLLLILGLLGILTWYGMGAFWPSALYRYETKAGEVFLAELEGRRESRSSQMEREAGNTEAKEHELYLQVGNRDVYPIDFRWVAEDEIVAQSRPEDVAAFERYKNGIFFGRISSIRSGDRLLASGHEDSLAVLRELMPRKAAEREEIRRIEKSEGGDLAYAQNAVTEKLTCLDQRSLSAEEKREERARLEAELAELVARSTELTQRLERKRAEFEREVVSFELVDGRELGAPEPVGEIFWVYEPNRMNFWERVSHYLAKIWEFLSEDPRHANTEGGIFPAIFGTVLMVFLMTFAVTPFGILAALYLREYARQGTLVGIVRIAVNNLAGVPSIVFGLFGLGFFIYLIGGTIDAAFYSCKGNTPTFGTGGILWAALTLALLTMPVVIVATEEGLASVPSEVRHGSVALGATKWETTWRVVIPAASPGMLTGVILAIARAAGEVAPLMLVGAVKFAKDLPFDHHFPYIHLERKFMHLGFHIYDLGFQSPNAEAARPMVYATALLLILLVTLMNIMAIVIRNHLRAKYSTSVV